ncbi:hypothetical protein Slin15195_G072700 [Septoria linicola]|uniref:Uncharacterized protein n=1 Tax=Septoria linicola TaxID=215465 RepID=A0A9Q9B0A7_9PEZI|nr:hypothetical protein Slin15195_G072700 [Septoria linicola]
MFQNIARAVTDSALRLSNSSIPSSQSNTGPDSEDAMRLDSVEAQGDAWNALGFRAQQTPRVQEATRRLQAIAGDRAAEPWFDMNQVRVWLMPQKAIGRPRLPTPGMGDDISMLATLPNFVIDSPSPTPRQVVQEQPRPSLKRKPQDGLESEQPPAQRPHFRGTQDEQDQGQLLYGHFQQLPSASSSYDHQNRRAAQLNSHVNFQPGASASSSAFGPSMRSPVTSNTTGGAASWMNNDKPLPPTPAFQHPNQMGLHLDANTTGVASSANADSVPAPLTGNMIWRASNQTSQSLSPIASSPRTQARVPSFNPQRVTLFPPLLPHYNRASPPPYTHAVQQEITEAPLHWRPDLSRKVCEWLLDADTDCRQSQLTEIMFGDIYRKHEEGCRPPSPMFKLKVTRMTISSHAVIEQAGSEQFGVRQLLDWFVIEYSEKQAPGGRPRNYWLLAFPVCAVTRSVCRPAPSVRPDDTRANNAMALHTTTWTLGRTNRLPILHGNGVRSGYLEDFIRSCELGLGQIEMTSYGPPFTQARYA